jgi:hypothetical protein
MTKRMQQQHRTARKPSIDRHGYSVWDTSGGKRPGAPRHRNTRFNNKTIKHFTTSYHTTHYECIANCKNKQKLLYNGDQWVHFNSDGTGFHQTGEYKTGITRRLKPNRESQ